MQWDPIHSGAPNYDAAGKPSVPAKYVEADRPLPYRGADRDAEKRISNFHAFDSGCLRESRIPARQPPQIWGDPLFRVRSASDGNVSFISSKDREAFSYCYKFVTLIDANRLEIATFFKKWVQ